ncbi:site-specific integrase [Robbsia sp. KACC 23696]|uniref:site-specific integrase n=1 Tax=Robbsia sp. KACC 23696 TaxID=3149231 RepID=UPI00325B70E4
MHKLPHLYRNRFGVYYLRLTSHGREVKRSLRTKDFKQAKLFALSFNLELAMSSNRPKITDFNFDLSGVREFDVVLPDGTQIKDIKTPEDVSLVKQLFGDRLLNVGPLPTLDLPTLAPNTLTAVVHHQAEQAVAKRRSKPLTDVIGLYLKEKALDNAARTLSAKRQAFSEFAASAGEKPMDDYALADAVAFKNGLIEANGSASRINAKLSFLRDLFAYAINNGLYVGGNPFAAAKVSSKSKLEQQKRSYKPFSSGDLRRIFSPDSYSVRMDKPAYYWLPFLALYTGARLEELASLSIEQVQRDGDVWFFEITKGKNSNSLRRIPLHRTVVESDFLTYVDRQRVAKQVQVFPDLKPGKNGYGKNVTRRFADYLDELTITDDRKVFHSFRHTFINRMTELSVHPAMLMALVGHYEQSRVDFSSPHFSNYQHNKALAELKQTIDRFDLELPRAF